MQFFKTLLVFSAAFAGHVSAMPSTKSALVGAGEAPDLGARASSPQTPNKDFNIADLLPNFSGRSPANSNGSMWSGSLSGITQNIIDEIDSGSLNFNQMVQEGLKFVNETLSEIDLNHMASEVGQQTSKLVSRAVDPETIPGGSVLSMLGSATQYLLGKFNLNSMVQSGMYMTSKVLSYVNFNWIIKTILGMVKSLVG